MIKRKIKIKRPKRLKRKNPYLADVGYHVTDSKNLQSILDEGFVRKYAENYYHNYALLKIADFFFEGRRPIYFLDIDDLNKISPLMKIHLEEKDLLLKVDVSDYDLQPDYNMLVIDYKFKIFSDIKDKNFFLSIREEDLKFSPYQDLKNIFFNYGEIKNNGNWCCIPLKTIKNNDEIKEELIYFTETFCINEDIPPSKILEFYEIEK